MTAQPPTTGRPKLAAGERKTAKLPPIRMTEAELAHVEAQAAAAGRDVTDYARRRVLGHTVAPARSETDERALLELNRVGVNLNQIARSLNSDRPEHGDLAAALDDFRRVAAVLVAAHGS